MSTEHTILGVISFTPCSGYDMKVEFEKGGAGMLSALSFGSIYPKLKQLERDGFIKILEVNTEGRRKKVYELTAKGWQELAQWLDQPSDPPFPIHDQLLLKMLFWGPAGQDREMLIEHLQARRREIRHLLHELREWQRNGFSFIDEYAALVFNYGEMRLEAELVWLEKAIAQLEGSPHLPLQDVRQLAQAQKARRAAAFREQPELEPAMPEPETE